MSIADYRTYARAILKEAPQRITDAELDLFIAQAAAQYSRDRPRWVIDAYTATSTPPFVAGQVRYAVPTRFENEFSVLHPIEPVECPIDKNPPDFMRLTDDVTTQQVADEAFQIVFTGGAPTGPFRLKFSIRHLVDATNDTVRLKDKDAVKALAASYALRALASYYANTSAPEITVDVVDYRSKSREYTSLAAEQEKLYVRHVQGTKESLGAASAVSHERARMTWGADRVFHPNQWR